MFCLIFSAYNLLLFFVHCHSLLLLSVVFAPGRRGEHYDSPKIRTKKQNRRFRIFLAAFVMFVASSAVKKGRVQCKKQTSIQLTTRRSHHFLMFSWLGMLGQACVTQHSKKAALPLFLLNFSNKNKCCPPFSSN